MIQQKTINKDLTNQPNSLSVQITLSGLSFLVTSPAGVVRHFSEENFDQAHTPEELYLKLVQCFASTPELNGSFDQVKIIYSNPLFSIVPKALFDEEKASEYLKLNAKILRNDFVSHDTLTDQELVTVYVPFVNINNYIFDRFGNFKYYHAVSVLLKKLLKKEKYSLTPKVFLYVQNDSFYAIVLVNGKLELCNTFNYKSPEDFIYYVLFCYEQLEFDTNLIETVLMGAIHETDDLHKMIYTYIRNSSFYEYNDTVLSEKENHESLLLKLVN